MPRLEHQSEQRPSADTAASYYALVNNSGRPRERVAKTRSRSTKRRFPLGYPCFLPFFLLRLLLFARPRDFISRNSLAQECFHTRDTVVNYLCATRLRCAGTAGVRRKRQRRERAWRRRRRKRRKRRSRRTVVNELHAKKRKRD